MVTMSEIYTILKTLYMNNKSNGVVPSPEITSAKTCFRRGQGRAGEVILPIHAKIIVTVPQKCKKKRQNQRVYSFLHHVSHWGLLRK